MSPAPSPNSGFGGVYLDANAIAPERMTRLADKLTARSIDVVDGGVIGGPAWPPVTATRASSSMSPERA
jgi:hypothetical protein